MARGIGQHVQEAALRNFALRKNAVRDERRIMRHLAVCGTSGKCHRTLTRIEDELFGLATDVGDLANDMVSRAVVVDGETTDVVSASDVARLVRLAHDRRVLIDVCFSEEDLRAAVDNSMPEWRKIRTHARRCPFCRVYLSGSGQSLNLGASKKPVAVGSGCDAVSRPDHFDGAPFAEDDDVAANGDVAEATPEEVFEGAATCCQGVEGCDVTAEQDAAMRAHAGEKAPVPVTSEGGVKCAEESDDPRFSIAPGTIAFPPQSPDGGG